MKLPVISFIDTSHINPKFFNQRFQPEMLGNHLGRKPVRVGGFLESNEVFDERVSLWETENNKVLFEDWICKKRTNWLECVNEKGDKIEFYVITYKINGVELPYPYTLDNFITDCFRLNIKLYWRKDLVDMGYDIYHIVSQETSANYINEMLTTMDKL